MLLPNLKPIRLLSLTILSATTFLAFMPVGTVAQSFAQPAEFPPQGYSGKQYVDSKGCVFIRAGIDGSPTWVPRVTRSREQICNAVPTFANGVPKELMKGSTKTAEAPVILPPPGDALPAATASVLTGGNSGEDGGNTPATMEKPNTVRVIPATIGQTAAAPAVNKKKPVSVAAAPVVVPRSMPAALAPQPLRVLPPPAPAPLTVARVAAPPVQAPAPRIVVPASRAMPAAVAGNATTGCPNLSPIAQRYVAPVPGVRCGPQAQSPTAGYMGQSETRAPVLTTRLTPTTRIVPRHVAAIQAQSADIGAPPAGYRPVWEDDRLNKQRAHQTLEGRAQMYLRWTRDVPHRLIDIRSGADVTAFNPDLVYPFVDVASQNAAAAAQAQGKRVVVISSKSSAPITASAPRISSSAPKPAQTNVAKAATGARFVQVGSFGVASNAQATIAKLQGMGLPVSSGQITRGGKPLKLVMAGPFADDGSAAQALRAVHSAGYRDAFLRR
ncbi:MAG: SPOR domain-containing protein [Rhodobacteraceae bacterium]|nr:SPOR domain-containing protein [Paracoccaceae bacterium]